MKKCLIVIASIILSVSVLFGTGITAFALEGSEYDEAQRLYNEFLNAMSDYGSTQAEQMTMEWFEIEDYGVFSEFYYETTAKYEQEYLDMDAHERLIWYVTYIDIAMHIYYLVGINEYGEAKNYDYWKDSVCSNARDWLAPCKDEVLSAYDELMRFSYDYYVEHDAVYCFMENKDSSDYLTPEFINNYGRNLSNPQTDTETENRVYTFSDTDEPYVQHESDTVFEDDESDIAVTEKTQSRTVSQDDIRNAEIIILLIIAGIIVGFILALLIVSAIYYFSKKPKNYH